MSSFLRKPYRRAHDGEEQLSSNHIAVPSELLHSLTGSEQTLHNEIEHIGRPEEAFSIHTRQWSHELDSPEHPKEPLLQPSTVPPSLPASPPQKVNSSFDLRPLPPRPSFRWTSPDTIRSKAILDRQDSCESTWTAGPQIRMWNPVWLRKSVLVAFAGLFIAMIVAVSLLYSFSVRNHGLSTQTSSYHYGWTYGPTAVLTLVVAFWRQVDISNRQLAPWQELQNGPGTAGKTVLLDYMSPILPSILYNAIRNGHWAIVVSTVGVLLLKLTTIFSTGLLVLEPTTMSKTGFPLALRSEFDASNYSIAEVNAVPGELFYGAQSQGLQYPLGTGLDIAVQTFQSQLADPTDALYSAEVLGFKTDLDCEIINISNSSVVQTRLPSIDPESPFFLVNITTPSCSLKDVILAQGADNGYHYHIDIQEITQNYQGRFNNYTCSDGVDNSLLSSERVDDTENSNHRILMTMTDLRWDVPEHSGNGAAITSWWIQDITAVLCRPSYTLDKYTVDLASSRNSSSDPVRATLSQNRTEKLDGLSDADVGPAVAASLEAMSLGSGGEDYVLANAVPTFFQLLASSNGGSRQAPFMDAQLLLEKGSAVFKGVMTQIAHQYLLRSADSVVVGSMSYSEDRLQVKELSAGFMIVLLGLLCLVAISLLFLRPFDVVPRDPGSITTMLTLLATSSEFSSLLIGLGKAKDSAIRRKLSDALFRSKLALGPERPFIIEPVSTTEKEAVRWPGKGSNFRWWNPIATQRWFAALAILSPLLIIAILEVLQHHSDNHDGILNVDSSGTATSHLLITYIPALVMMIAASLFNSIQSTVATFAPYAMLRRGNARASRSISMNLLRKMPAHAFFLAAKAASAVLGITILAAFVGAFLTIVVSGLYIVASVPTADTVAMRPSDWFNFTQADLSLSDYDAGGITSLISYSNLTYPLWTYEHLVFNTLSLSQAQDNVSDASVELNVPAFRAKLNCSSLPAHSYTATPVQYSLSNDSSLYKEGMLEVTISYTVPIHCERMITSQETVPWQQSFHVPNDTSPAYVGQATLLQWNDYDNDVNLDGPGGVESSLSLYTGDFGCPTFAFTLGTASANHTLNETDSTSKWSASADMSVVLCYQNLEQVETDIVLELADMSFNTSRPPSPDESTAKLLTYPNTTSEIFEWAVNIWLVELSNTAGNQSLLSPDGGPSSANDLDVFMQTLVQGRNGVAMDQLVGEANLDRLIASASDLYSTYMAQAISNNMRNTTSSGIPDKDYNATLTNPDRLRLQQNRQPKVALQAMLAFLALAAIATYALADMRKVLPHNPCSIAGTATLLAGSELCTRDIIPEGAEWRSDEELMKARVFDGMLFRMGWRDHVTGDGSDGAAVEKSFGIEVEKKGGVA